MNYLGTKKIETKNLILRPTQEEDLKILWNILCDIDVSKYYLVGKFNFDWEQEKKWQYKKLEKANNKDVFQWSIILKSNNRCIGQISCQNSYDKDGNLQDDSIRDVGWFLDSKYQGMGFGTESSKAILEYMFNEVKIDRIDTSAAIDNPASWKLMDKLGFIKTGTIKKTKYTMLNDEVDCYCYTKTNDVIYNLYLYKPKLEDYWYEQKLLSDPKTMNYNAGWDVSYNGYHYDTGCIDFPKETWLIDYEKRKNDKVKFFRYIVRKEDNEFIGYLNFHLSNNDKYEIGIVIEDKYRGVGYSKEAMRLLIDEAFNVYNIDALYDSFEEARTDSCKTFFDLGFKITNKFKGKRFNQDINIVEICLKRENYENSRI